LSENEISHFVRDDKHIGMISNNVIVLLITENHPDFRFGPVFHSGHSPTMPSNRVIDFYRCIYDYLSKLTSRYFRLIRRVACRPLEGLSGSFSFWVLLCVFKSINICFFLISGNLQIFTIILEKLNADINVVSRKVVLMQI